MCPELIVTKWQIEHKLRQPQQVPLLGYLYNLAIFAEHEGAPLYEHKTICRGSSQVHRLPAEEGGLFASREEGLKKRCPKCARLLPLPSIARQGHHIVN